MESLIQTYLPNVYKMGWAGQAGVQLKVLKGGQ